MSVYKQAIDRVRNHPGFLSHDKPSTKYLLNAEPEAIASFIKGNGGLITVRHDLNARFTGRDFLVNLMTETHVLHVAPDGHYSLHRWQKLTACSQENRLTGDKEAYLLDTLFLVRRLEAG